MRDAFCKFAVLAAAVLCISPLNAQELVIGTLNTESASDTNVYQVAELIRNSGFVDVWALQEVEDLDALEEYTIAAGAAGARRSFRYILSESGEIRQMHRKNDFLGIVYNSSRLRHVETVELHGIRSRSATGVGGRLGEPDWGLRGAQFVRFQDRTTLVEFYVGNVHLKCCGSSDDGPQTREHQAEIMKTWIDRTDAPVILTGDSNIPVSPGSSTGNPSSSAFQTITSVLQWREPTNPVKTQCSPSFDSMLDHFFANDTPNLSFIDATIKNEDASFCEDEKTGGPDHRPVVARFALSN